MTKQKPQIRKYTDQDVLDLLWSIRHQDKFYFDTYGKMWLKEMVKESMFFKKK